MSTYYYLYCFETEKETFAFSRSAGNFYGNFSEEDQENVMRFLWDNKGSTVILVDEHQLDDLNGIGYVKPKDRIKGYAERIEELASKRGIE